jgi:EAL domain-containing protein (putative c-di-GMP-specific phosphodiesterase class I)
MRAASAAGGWWPISRLTDRGVAQAAMQAARWHADNLALEVAVNISARDMLMGALGHMKGNLILAEAAESVAAE